jgi:hypothetical protein
MSTGKTYRRLKGLAGVLLLPACVGATLATWELGRTLLGGGTTPAGRALAAGYVLWLAVFALLPRPTRTYVLGHELTHAIGAWMMGARVWGLRVGPTGGQVRTSKTNWVIALAPYFFPFYAMLFIAGFFLGHWIWDFSRHYAVLFFLVGLGWSFHVTFTLMVLLTVRQPDVASQGVCFSAVVIYLMNLVTMTVTTVALSPSLEASLWARVFAENIAASYMWTLDKLAALWEYAAASWNPAR